MAVKPTKLRCRLGVYAGSFDPLTIGHLWMIQEGARLFEQLTVAIGINPDKKYQFTVVDRLAMLRESCRDFPNVSFAAFSNLYLIDYAKSVGATHILRGIRSAGDYEFERTMRNIAEVSSSLVKGMIGPTGWRKIVSKYVPAPVYRRLLTLHK